MSFTGSVSWISRKLSKGSRNDVVPIQINVKPRRQSVCQKESRKMKSESIVSVSTVENDLQLVRRWHAMDNNIPRVVASGIIGNIGPFEEKTGEQIEMLTKVSTSVQRYVLPETESSIGQSTNQLAEISPWIQTRPVVQNGNGISRIVLAKNAVKRLQRQSKPSSYIHTYMTLMYIFGTSAFRTRERIFFKGRMQWLNWTMSRLQLVMFILVVSLSAFQPFCQAKYNILCFLYEGGFNRFVRFSYNVTCLATSVFGAYILCHKWKSVVKMVNVMKSYETTWATVTNNTTFCVPLAMFTITLAVLKSILIIDLDNFSVEDALLTSSNQMGEDLFIWSSANLNETTAQAEEDFGTDINSMTLLLCVIKIVRDFAFFLQHGMLWDLIGSVVITLYCWMNFFMKFVTEVVENVLDENSEEWITLQRKREIVWKMYREIRCVFEAVNDVFGPLLLLFHVTNVLRYAFFLEHCIYPGDVYAFTYFNLLLNIIKSEIIYVIASNMAHQNILIRKCLRNWGSRTDRIDVGYTEITLTAILDELDMEPLGFGQGNFVIHQGFHFGLFGLVSSLFVMLASKKP